MGEVMKNFRKCSRPILAICFFCISCTINLFAQNKASKEISSITIHGIEKNKESYLNQFIQSELGNLSFDSLLVEDVQRLKNLPSIGNAFYTLDTTMQSVEVNFHIEEVKTLIPVVNFGRVRNNTWVQLGFYESNLRGRGSFLSAIYQNRDVHRHGAQVYYRADRIRGTNWGFSASLNKFASQEPLFFEESIVNYNYDNYGLGLTLSRHFGFRHKLEFGVTYFVEEYQKSEEQFSENPVGPSALTEPKYLSKIEYTGDFLDYHFFYLDGLYWKIALQNVYTLSDQSWFRSVQASSRYFKRIGADGNLAIRLVAGFATNSQSPFAPFVIDSHINLRGVGNRTARGTAQLILNAEYRLTISDTENWGIQLVTFLDIGNLRKPGGALEDLVSSSQYQKYFGSGFRLIYKKFHGAVLRVDYGLNIQDITQAGAVIGFGQYF